MLAIDTNTIHCPGAFCIYQTKKTLDSSFLFEIKAADWQNVGCATYLLSGRISKTSRNRCWKLISSRSSLLCYSSLYIFYWFGLFYVFFKTLTLKLMIRALLSLVLTPYRRSFFSLTYAQPVSTLLLIKNLWTGLMVIWSSINSLDQAICFC